MAAREVWRSVRWPLFALVDVAALLLVATLLDTGSAGARDAALLLGAVTLYVLLPVVVIWLGVALVRALRRGDDAVHRP